MRSTRLREKTAIKGLLIIVLLLCSALTVPPDESCYRVLKVYDGDTILIRFPDGKVEKVRYIGIDAPERYKPYHLQAKKKNLELLRKGEIRLEFDVKKKDRYGRWLAYVYSGKIMINAELIRLGLARVYHDEENTRYGELFEQLEKEARENHSGIWKKRSYY
jgi:micrococcal nuclease